MKHIAITVYNGEVLQYVWTFPHEPSALSMSYPMPWTHIRMFHGKRPIKTVRNEWGMDFCGVTNYFAGIADRAGYSCKVDLRVPWLKYPGDR